MKKNDFRQKMLEMHKNDADIYKIKKKHNDLGTNSKISLITYNTNNELLIIKETDSNEPIQVIKTSKDNLDLSDDTKLTTESLNLNSNNFSVKEIEKILPTVDTIIKDTDDKLYGISFGKIKQIGVSDSIDDSVSVKDLNRWVENSFNYNVVDKEFSDTAIVYNKFHYHDYHYNHKLRKNKLQVSDEFGDTELLVLSKEIMYTMQHGTEEEKYSIIFDRYSLNKNTRYRLLSTAQIVEYGAYITYFDGLNNRHGELIETMENGDKKFHVYHPSNVVKGINATESNTYTYEFELICGPDNSLKNFRFLQKLDYCRVIEGNSFKNYYRSPVTKVATGVYKYIGSTSSNVAPNTTLTSTSNTAASGTTAGVHRGYGELKSGAETGAATYHIYDSRYCTGINATSTNTKTTPYILTVNDYNKVTTNCTATTVLDYGRVIEGTGGNAKFANYYRTQISCIHSGNNVYRYTGTNTTIKNRYGYLKSGSATAPTGDVTYELYVTHNASGTDSDVAKGYNADANNTYTKRYTFTLDKYNSVKANGVYNASSTPDFDYSRVVEGGNKFVNYLRNPMLRTSSYRVNYNNKNFDINKHVSGQTYLSDYYLYRYWETVDCDSGLIWECEDVNGYVTYGYLTYTIDKYNDKFSYNYTEKNEHTHQSWQGHSYPSGGKPYNINTFLTTDPSTWNYS